MEVILFNGDALEAAYRTQSGGEALVQPQAVRPLRTALRRRMETAAFAGTSSGADAPEPLAAPQNRNALEVA